MANQNNKNPQGGTMFLLEYMCQHKKNLHVVHLGQPARVMNLHAHVELHPVYKT